jgi:hypothetical protein
MIEKTHSFKTSDGNLWPTIEEAQKHELELFLKEAKFEDGTNLATALLDKRAHIVDLLTMKATSHAKARKINGATKTRKVAAVQTPVKPATT